jgi:hypothetical protein
VVSKTGVPSFTPELPDPVIISKEAVGRDFFLHKRKRIRVSNGCSGEWRTSELQGAEFCGKDIPD